MMKRKAIIENIITGLALGTGFALSAIIIKALLKFIDRADILPQELKSELYSDLSYRSKRH